MSENIAKQPQQARIDALKAHLRTMNLVQILLILGKIPNQQMPMSGSEFINYFHSPKYQEAVTFVNNSQQIHEKNLGEE
jgi:hypothetical protein